MDRLLAVDDRTLAMRLFMPVERWGHEHTPPGPAQSSPYAAKPPVWVEPPPPPELQRLRSGSHKAWIALPVGVLISFWALLMLSAFKIDVVATVIFYTILLVTAIVVIWPQIRFAKAKRAQFHSRAEQVTKFQQARQSWETHVRQYDQAEQHRVTTAMHWHPAAPVSNPQRVDVFGGVPDGWASLLATTGSSLLSTGAGMLVLDFTEHAVARELGQLATARSCPATTVALPDDTRRVGLLAGLTVHDVAELIAEAAASKRTSDDADALRAVDVDLITTVASRLDQPVTFTRLDAGLRALRSLYDNDAENILSAREVSGLRTLAEKMTVAPRSVDELQVLSNLISLLAADEHALRSAEPVQLWPATGLAILTTASRHPRRRDALDRVVTARMLHELRAGHATPGDVIVVAGADHLGLTALEALSKQTRRCRVRLVFMLEHLREDAVKLLGGSDSASILMRLGNAAEAAAAADFIGKGHKFLLSQLSEQVGRTLTHGTSDTRGDSWTTSDSRGHNGMMSSVSTSTGRTASWSATVSESTADTTNTGTTVQRTYEYTVEPTTLQSLPPTAFILVETVASGRRVVAADANPGIVLLDKVADKPIAARPIQQVGSTGAHAISSRQAQPSPLIKPTPRQTPPGMIER